MEAIYFVALCVAGLVSGISAVFVFTRGRTIFFCVLSGGLLTLGTSLVAHAFASRPTYQSMAVVAVKPTEAQRAAHEARHQQRVDRQELARRTSELALQATGVLIPIAIVGLLAKGQLRSGLSSAETPK